MAVSNAFRIFALVVAFACDLILMAFDQLLCSS